MKKNNTGKRRQAKAERKAARRKAVLSGTAKRSDVAEKRLMRRAARFQDDIMLLDTADYLCPQPSLMIKMFPELDERARKIAEVYG